LFDRDFFPMPEWSGALSSGETQTSYAGSKISATIKLTA